MTDTAFVTWVRDLRETFPSKPWADAKAPYWRILRAEIDRLAFTPGELARAFGRLLSLEWWPDNLVLTLRAAVEAIRADDRASGVSVDSPDNWRPHPDGAEMDAHWRTLSEAEQREWMAHASRCRPLLSEAAATSAFHFRCLEAVARGEAWDGANGREILTPPTIPIRSTPGTVGAALAGARP